MEEEGCFVEPSRQWFAEQRRLNDRYESLEEIAGKIVTIDDVDLSSNADASSDRRQPTAAEFMAHITVEVTTHMDLAAESRTRPRGKARPDASEFVPDEFDVPGHREASGLVERDGDGQPDVADVDPETDLGKPNTYVYELEDNAVQEVALHEGIGVAPAMKRYRDGFLAGFAATGRC